MGRVPSGRVPVVVMGLGHIGREICRAALASEEVELLGVVDHAPGLSGTSLGELLGMSSSLRVSTTLKDAKAPKGAVLLHATGSHLEAVLEELLQAVRQGHAVVSTCEELAFPFLRHPELAERLDRAAMRAGVSVVGTGVNPGSVSRTVDVPETLKVLAGKAPWSLPLCGSVEGRWACISESVCSCR